MKYFESALKYMECKISNSMLVFIQRVCVMILLFNADVSINIFSWIYMVLALYFWVIQNSQYSIKTMNLSSIVVILLQYTIILMNISPKTSPIWMPAYLYEEKTLSLIEYLSGTSEDQWLEYFGFISTERTTFIINGLILFFIALFFSLFSVITKYIIGKTRKMNKGEVLKSKLFVNFQAWRSGAYVFLNTVYEGMVIYGHVYILLLVLIISSYNYSIFNLVIIISNLGFLFYVEMVLKYPFQKEHLVHLLRYFKFLKIYLFFLLFLKLVYKIPYIQDQITTENLGVFLYSQISDFQISDKIVMLFFITVLYDILSADDYDYIVTKNAKNAKFQGKIIALCMAFKEHGQKIEHQYENTKE